MKIKLLIFLLLFSFCSAEVVDDGIFIDPVDLKNLKILETNENIDLSNNNFLIINYWASWCLECIEEHPYLIELSKTKGKPEPLMAPMAAVSWESVPPLTP